MNAIDQQPVLVTGATGFIGTRLVLRLIARHCRVTCLVRPNSKPRHSQSAGVEMVTGDVTDQRSVERALSQSQAGTLFHLAGLVKAQRQCDFMRVNAGGVKTVAAACAGRATPPGLVVLSSLSAAGPSAADQMLCEDDACTPVSNYGRSKFAGEQAAVGYAGTVPISIVRPPIVFGPGDRGMLEMFHAVARWGLHLVPGNGDNRLSLIHADDLVEGLLLVAERGERLCEHASLPPDGKGIYFIADDEHLTYGQLGNAIAEALGQKPPCVLRIPGPVLRWVGIGKDTMALVSGKPGWISSDKIADALAGSWTCSSAKARSQLNWSPNATLSDRLSETAQWYRQAGWL